MHPLVEECAVHTHIDDWPLRAAASLFKDWRDDPAPGSGQPLQRQSGNDQTRASTPRRIRGLGSAPICDELDADPHPDITLRLKRWERGPLAVGLELLFCKSAKLGQH